MAAPTISNTYTDESSSNAKTHSVSVNGGSEFATGDLLLIKVEVDGSPGAISIDLSGATKLFQVDNATSGQENSLAVFHKTLVSGDTSTTSIEASWPDSNEKSVIAVFRIAASEHDGIDVSASSDEGSTTTPESPTVTTTVNDCLVFVTEGHDGGATSTHPTDTTEQVDLAAGGGGLVKMSVATFTQATAGATGAKQWTLSNSRGTNTATVGVAPAASSGVTGTMSLTDGGETISMSGEVDVEGTMSLTDEGETLSFSGEVAVSGTMALTDGGETLQFSGGNVVSGTLSLADGGETLSMSGEVAVSGTISLVDGGETISMSGGPSIQGTLALTDGGEALSMAGGVEASGTLTLTDSGETFSFTNIAVTEGVISFVIPLDKRDFVVPQDKRDFVIPDVGSMYTFNAHKDPNAVKPYSIDWTNWLPSGDSVSSVESNVSAPTGDSDPVVVDSSSISGAKTILVLSAGTDGNTYEIRYRMTSANGHKEDAVIKLLVTDN